MNTKNEKLKLPVVRLVLGLISSGLMYVLLRAVHETLTDTQNHGLLVYSVVIGFVSAAIAPWLASKLFPGHKNHNNKH